MKEQLSGHPNKVGLFNAGPVFLKIPTHLIFQSILIMLVAALVSSGCKNDLAEIQSLDFTDTLPDLTARQVEMYYSESAEVEMELESPLILSFKGDEPYTEFPEGFIVYFYDSLNQVKSTISADYGINYEKDKLMVARYNVKVVNVEKNEKLNTEELFWNQRKELIYSDKFVRLTRGEEVITGDGLRSDQQFEEIEIINPRGLIEVEDEEL
jgi:LPS export ABC transporter protein LptC